MRGAEVLFGGIALVMPKTEKTLRKGGPKKERLVITEDQHDARKPLLTRAQVSDLRTKFREAHKDGLDALKRHDYGALTDAINRERKIADIVKQTVIAIRKLTN
jgi:hypothetical protein